MDATGDAVPEPVCRWCDQIEDAHPFGRCDTFVVRAARQVAGPELAAVAIADMRAQLARLRADDEVSS